MNVTRSELRTAYAIAMICLAVIAVAGLAAALQLPARIAPVTDRRPNHPSGLDLA